MICPVENVGKDKFIKGDFFKSPLEKGDSGGCLTSILPTLNSRNIKLDYLR